jgi:formylglycine-generating enzyme required for sulfatase activity
MTWYQAAYCNGLSEREGYRRIWGYAPNKAADYAKGICIKPGHLTLTRYRLRPVAEWEFACRGGARTSGFRRMNRPAGFRGSIYYPAEKRTS